MCLTPAAFLAALNDCLGRALWEGERLAVAVSGGADSLALLLLAAETLPARVTALTVDHGLRAESGAEAAAVARICRDIGVRHAILPALGLTGGANLQARAREARYAAMAQYCLENGLGLLATAHHADDQAETLLMRLARGAGTRGVSGIRGCRPLAPSLLLVRPLLGWRKQMLAGYVGAAGLKPAEDLSNDDVRFDRTRARRVLAENDWLDVDGMAAAVRHIAADAEALDWVTERAWDGRSGHDVDGWNVDVEGLPPALRYRLTIRALAKLGCEAPRGPAAERLIASLTAGKTATVGGVQARPGRLWRFSPAPSRRMVRSD